MIVCNWKQTEMELNGIQLPSPTVQKTTLLMESPVPSERGSISWYCVLHTHGTGPAVLDIAIIRNL